MEKPKPILKRFVKDNSGVVWVWAVVIIGLIIYSLVWFSTGFALMEVIDVVEGEYTFASPISHASLFIKTMFQYHPLLFLFGMLLWAYVNSQRKVQV